MNWSLLAQENEARAVGAILKELLTTSGISGTYGDKYMSIYVN
jgi:hypothetical protein